MSETSTNSKTDISALLGDLNAGVFEQQINQCLSDVAANVVTTGKAGELTIKLKFKQIGESHQVAMSHSLKSVIPHQRGRTIEETASDTPLHVGRGGKLTLYPEEQLKLGLPERTAS